MTMNDFRDALANDNGELPERWNPDDEAGTSLIGTFCGYETIATRLGEAQIAVVEDADDGTRWGVFLGRTVLKKRFETLHPQIGDTLGLKYVGWVEPRNKDANGYHNYVLKVMRAEGAPVAASDKGDPELPF